MSGVIFYDTNCLLEGNIPTGIRFTISTVTLEELEGIKTARNKDDSIKFSAREAIRFLKEHDDLWDAVIYDKNTRKIIDASGLEPTNDNKIIACAVQISEFCDVTYVTNDKLASLIASEVFHLPVRPYFPMNDGYSGVKRLCLSDNELAHFYQEPSDFTSDALINEYLLLKNEDGEDIDLWKKHISTETGEVSHSQVKKLTFESQFFGKVKPMKDDPYQMAYMDSLSTNLLTMVRGTAGTGKSYLALTYMLRELEKHRIDKIIIFSNPLPSANSAKLGFLPGTQLDKLIDSSIGNMLAGKFGDKMGVERLVQESKIEILPMCDVRGYDTDGQKCCVYITEAQNFDVYLLKLALQRVGKDTQVIIDGDYNQSDNINFLGSNNGMRRMSEVFRGRRIYGEVELQNIHRSEIARIADSM